MASTTKTPPQERLYTADEFYLMTGLERCELVNGRIVPMPPPPNFEHGEVELNLAAELRTFVRASSLGRVAVGEVAVLVQRDPDSVRGADIVFISREHDARRTAGKPLDVAPDLIVEVLSPSNVMSEMMQKLREYFAIGVRLVWLVDPAARTVYAYRSLSDLRQFTDQDQLPGDDVLPGFAVPVAKLFE